MLASEQTNSSPVKKNSPFMETVQDKLKDIKNFSNWSAKEQMVAVGAVGVMVGALLPFVAVALPVAATGAIVALTLFFAVKAVEYTFKGLKWSVEKTVDGAKYTAEKVKDASTYAAGKIRDGAVRARDSVKEGYENSVDLLKRGTSFVGEGVANKFHRASGKEDYLDKIKRFAPEEIRKSDEIRNDLKAIFADKENNSGLVKSILSGVLSKIDLKIEEKIKLGETDQALERLLVQGKFISGLSEKSLHSLLTERSLPKDTYLIDSIFSDHHDEIKRIVGECKREYESDQSVRRNNAKDAEERKASKSFSLSSVFSLRRKDSEQSNSLSKSNSLNSIGTESTATVSDSDSQDFATVRRSNSSNSLNASPKLTSADPPKVSGSPSTDSGFNSPSDSPTYIMFTNKDGTLKTQDDLRDTGYLNKLVVQPSTKVDIVDQQFMQVKQSLETSV